MSAAPNHPMKSQLLWGDFRAFVAGRDPDEALVTDFADKIDREARGETYGVSATGCISAIVAELNRRIAESR